MIKIKTTATGAVVTGQDLADDLNDNFNELTDFIAIKSIGKNKFRYYDPDIIRGAFYDGNMNLSTNSSYSITGYIPILAGQSMYCNTAMPSFPMSHILFDAAKTKLLAVNGTKYVTATVDGYVRFSLQINSTASLLTTQAEIGTAGTKYEPFTIFSNSIDTPAIKDNAVSKSKLDISLQESIDYKDVLLSLPLSVYSSVQLTANSYIIGSTLGSTCLIGGDILSIFNALSADFVGKKIRLYFKFKLSGDYSTLNISDLSIYGGDVTMTVTNRSKNIDEFGIVTAQADWLVVSPAYGQAYVTFSRSVASTGLATIKILGVYFSILDNVEAVSAVGNGTYVIKKVIGDVNSTNTADLSVIALPNIIPVAIGTELNVYLDTLRSITAINDKFTPLLVYGDGGNGSFKPGRFQYSKYITGAKSQFNLNIKEFTASGTLLQTVIKSIKDVGNANLLTGKPVINCLAIGDSITEHGYYELELQNKFKNASIAGGSDIRYFGTYPNYPQNWADGMTNEHSITLPYYTEGRGGWWTTNFLEATRHLGNSMDGANPFWNAARAGGADVDFIWYLNQINSLSRYSDSPISAIDVVSIMLGSNDMGFITIEQYITNLHTLCSKVWRDFPNCIVLIYGIPPRATTGGVTSGYTTAAWNKALYDAFETPIAPAAGTGRSYLVPLSFWVDREKGYGNPKGSRIPGESTLTNGHPSGWFDPLHPYIIGHLQMADAIFSGWQNAIELHNS